jgi:hypothetical protein|nr:T9SS type A sorting domain-containing protein [Candidatus Krumholzibacteria bacterium]
MKTISPPPLRFLALCTPAGLVRLALLVLVVSCAPQVSRADDIDPVTREAVAQELQLAHNSPNPFNANTTINFTLLADAWVRVDVFDLRGRYVTTLLDEFQSAGDRFAIWKTEVAPSGTYFFRLKVDDLQVFGKMSLVK